MQGQVFEIMPVNEEKIYRFEISKYIDLIEMLDPVTRKVQREQEDFWLFPAKHYVAGKEAREQAFHKIKSELQEQLEVFKKEGKPLEYERLKRKVQYDLELIANLGYCNGIENYSRHFDGRAPGEPPFTLLDYFAYAGGNEGGKFLTVVDESHVTLPQIRAMYQGDRARKDNLVNYGFRLPSARDNRPLTGDEFFERVDTMLYVSATPSQVELTESEQVVEQIVRPTGLVDPDVIIRPVTSKDGGNTQIEDVIIEIQKQIEKKERTLVTTLTKKMAEDVTEYLQKKGIQVQYLHSDIKTIQRIEIITELRKGTIDVLIGVNLLREGLDIPEVSLVAILDTDKEGFLRSDTSLIQTIGRAARNANGRVILYADEMTGSIDRALQETNRRRTKQLAYNEKHGITPQTIQKSIRNILEEFGISATTAEDGGKRKKQQKRRSVADLDVLGDSRPMKEIIQEKKVHMKEAAQNLEFELAAILRDEIRELESRERLSESGALKKKGRVVKK
jgi:excinuclease ABC subunit B